MPYHTDKEMLTNVSVAFTYREPSFTSDTTSQSFLGEKLLVLEEIPDWIRVRMEDDYEAWIRKAFVVPKPEDWEAHEMFIPNALWDFIRETPNPDAVALRDITIGSPLPLVDHQDGWVQVRLPDGQEGWLKDDPWQPPQQLSREDLLQTAFRFLGIQYFWGGRSPKGFDCSGFVQTVFRLHGFKLPRDSHQQGTVGQDLGRDWQSWEPADLIFFSEEEGKTITHVALHLGDGAFIHASGFVKINSLNPTHGSIYHPRLAKRCLGARRVLNLESK